MDKIPSAFQRLLGLVGWAFPRWGWGAEDAAAGARGEAGVPEGRGLAAMPQFPRLYNEGLGRMVSREVPEGQQKELWAWGRGGVIQVEGSLASIPGGRWGR